MSLLYPHKVQEKPFEMNRGLGKSFGYNIRLETEKETISIEELTRLFIDVVRYK